MPNTTSAPMPPLHILLLDNNAAEAGQIASALQQQGHQVTHLNSGQAALELLRQTPTDLLLMDVVLPDMEGYAAIRQIKLLQENRWAPVIVLTTLDDDENLIKTLEAGADDCLLKPIDFNVLQAKIRSMQRIAQLQHNAQDLALSHATTLDNLVDGVMVLDTQLHIESANPAIFRIFGYAPQQLLGQSAIQLWPEPLRENFLQLSLELIINSEQRAFCHDGQTNGQRCNGEVFPMEIGISIVSLHSGSRMICTIRDITERKRSETALRQQAQIIDQTHDSIIAISQQGLIESWNQGSERLYGYSAESRLGTPLTALFSQHTEQLRYVLQTGLRQTEKIELELTAITAAGQQRDISLSLSARFNSAGEAAGYIGYSLDISELKDAQRKLEYLASHDQLTRIPNRYLFNDRLHQALHKARRNLHKLAILFLDLDGFKQINDSFGHDAGDEVLLCVAERMSQLFRRSDSLARFGGDEFAVLLEEADQLDMIEMLAQRLIAAINQPILLRAGHRVQVGASLGIALYPLDGSSAENLLQTADLAMYKAKQMNKNNYQFLRDTHEMQHYRELHAH